MFFRYYNLNLQKQLKDKNAALSDSLAELNLLKKRMITQEKLASLGILAAGIAHEIKNPLNFINNFSLLTLEMIPYFEEICQKIQSTLSSEELKEFQENILTLKENLNMIYEQGTRTNSIVQRVLSHSRGEEGVPAKYDLHQLLKEAINLAYHSFRVQFPNFNTAIHKEFQGEVAPLTIFGEDVSRVFINLLNNAFYAVYQKSQHKTSDYLPDVFVKTKKVGADIEISIRDNGIGISPAAQKKLFSPFFTNKPLGEGTGLGLSLSYETIVQGHKGAIRCESIEGEFSEFTVILPIK